MELRLMTSNIWGDFFNNPVEKRAIQLEHIFSKYDPDVIGIQEATTSWWNSTLIPALNRKYEMVPAMRSDLPLYTPLFYRRDRFTLLKTDRYVYHRWLDCSKGWVCGVFRDNSDGKTFAVFCTHFMWKNGDLADTVRFYNARDIADGMKRISAEFNCPSIFLGDINCDVESHAWEYLHGLGYKSSFELTGDHSDFSSHHGDPVKDENGDYHGTVSENPKEKSIDHIGIPEGVRVVRQCHVADQEALDASDHCPVYADITL